MSSFKVNFVGGFANTAPFTVDMLGAGENLPTAGVVVWFDRFGDGRTELFFGSPKVTGADDATGVDVEAVDDPPVKKFLIESKNPIFSKLYHELEWFIVND